MGDNISTRREHEEPYSVRATQNYYAIGTQATLRDVDLKNYEWES